MTHSARGDRLDRLQAEPSPEPRLVRSERCGRANRRPGRTALYLMAIAAVAIFGISACSKPATQELDTQDKVPVVTRPATRGTIRPVVAATGMVKPATGAELLVSAPQSARIAEMPKGVGDRVRKGGLLVRFDIPSLNADASERRSGLASAEARLTNARAAEQRVRLLFQRHDIDDELPRITDVDERVLEGLPV